MFWNIRRIRSKVECWIREEQMQVLFGAWRFYILRQVFKGSWELAQPVHVLCRPGIVVGPRFQAHPVGGVLGVQGQEHLDSGPVGLRLVQSACWTLVGVVSVTGSVHYFPGQYF